MVEIKQTCDSCNVTRELTLGLIAGVSVELGEAAESDGWRTVRQNKHLCKKCINDLVN